MTQTSWSTEQLAFFSALPSGQNLFLRACAGSGKTTTIVEASRRVGPGARVVFLAFNKTAAETLEPKIPYYAQASTFHSYCLGALRRIGLAKGKPEGRKCAALLRKLVPKPADRKAWEDDALTLVSLAKSCGFGFLTETSHAELRELADRHALALDDMHLVAVQNILHESLAERQVLDFDDMLLLALLPEVRFDPCTHLFVDEAQDTNLVQRALLRKMIATGTKFIAVGDPSQSIYGFRGADSDACSALVREFSMTEMPLSVTYRCSQAVVAEARKFELGSELGSNLDLDIDYETNADEYDYPETPEA